METQPQELLHQVEAERIPSSRVRCARSPVCPTGRGVPRYFPGERNGGGWQRAGAGLPVRPGRNPLFLEEADQTQRRGPATEAEGRAGECGVDEGAGRRVRHMLTAPTSGQAESGKAADTGRENKGLIRKAMETYSANQVREENVLV